AGPRGAPREGGGAAGATSAPRVARPPGAGPRLVSSRHGPGRPAAADTPRLARRGRGTAPARPSVARSPGRGQETAAPGWSCPPRRLPSQRPVGAGPVAPAPGTPASRRAPPGAPRTGWWTSGGSLREAPQGGRPPATP